MPVIHPLVVRADYHVHLLKPANTAGGWGTWYCPTCGASWRLFVSTIPENQPRLSHAHT